MKKQPQTNPKPTFEAAWVDLQETRQILKETALLSKENERKIDKLRETIGGWDKNHGAFAEEYFRNSFKKRKRNFFGEHFNKMICNTKGLEIVDDEYDIILINNEAIGLIEVKFAARKKHLKRVISKIETFKINFPPYKEFKIYLGVASLSFPKTVEESCKKLGIAIIKQVGENVVIIDEGLKTY